MATMHPCVIRPEERIFSVVFPWDEKSKAGKGRISEVGLDDALVFPYLNDEGLLARMLVYDPDGRLEIRETAFTRYRNPYGWFLSGNDRGQRNKADGGIVDVSLSGSFSDGYRRLNGYHDLPKFDIAGNGEILQIELHKMGCALPEWTLKEYPLSKPVYIQE